MNTEPLHPGQRVQFKLADIHLPAIEEVLNQMTEETELQGTVTLLSDHGNESTSYAIIEVKGILMPIIVPVSRLQNPSDAEKAASTKSW